VNKLILVDENDLAVGTAEKMEAHEKALLHRAFSIFIFNSKGEMLLQQRALSKYHSGGLWTNACCSHPYFEQDTLAAAEKRLLEEMGFKTPLTKAFAFVYKANFDNGLTEHEYDHVFIGRYDGAILPDKDEVESFCFMSMAELKAAMQLHPQKYTAWFKIALPKLENYLASNS
jgi:isopentenyl-diphosphate delta-isomerase